MPKPTTPRRTAHTVYHRDGSVWASGYRKGGKPDGPWRWFRRSGTLMRSGHFAKGVQVGDWTTYDQRGKVYKVTLMKTAAATRKSRAARSPKQA